MIFIALTGESSKEVLMSSNAVPPVSVPLSPPTIVPYARWKCPETGGRQKEVLAHSLSPLHVLGAQKVSFGCDYTVY